MSITHGQLIHHLLQTGVLRSAPLIAAFEDTDRQGFVTNDHQVDCYLDVPLPIGHGQTISQPSTVAMMMEWLDPQDGHHILDIGSGSGWTTALLSHIVGARGHVTAMELIPELVTFGQDNCQSLSNTTHLQASPQEIGLPGKTFDRILVSASASDFPTHLLAQLKPNGKLVIPVHQSIMIVTKRPNGELQTQRIPGFIFVPLIQY